MAYDSYKIFSSNSSPRDKMMKDKASQVNYLFNIAMDRENNCLINGENFNSDPRIFDRKTKSNYSEVVTCETIDPNDKFYSGDILFYDGEYWLCTSSFVFHKLYCKGDFLKTNWKLKWQNELGEVVERWSVTSRQSSVGIDDNKVISLGANELKILIPFDTETIKLRKGKRVFIDYNSLDPTSYRIQLTNTTQYVQNGHGYLEFTVKETATIPDVDRPDLMLCNYISPTPPDPEPTTKPYAASISCLKPEIAVGKYGRTFTAVFKDVDGNAVTAITPKWTVTSTFTDKLTLTEESNYIKIITADNSLIDKTFLLKLEATDDSAEPVEISILITSIYG